MPVTCSEKNGAAILVLDGELMGGPDARLLTEKLHELAADGRKRIVVDLAAVDRMNSSGLGILIGGLTAIRNQGGDLKLVRVGKKPLELLRITKLERIFEIYPDEDQAIASFA
jgi:anti-sigma B factor antagonist